MFAGDGVELLSDEAWVEWIEIAFHDFGLAIFAEDIAEDGLANAPVGGELRVVDEEDERSHERVAVGEDAGFIGGDELTLDDEGDAIGVGAAEFSETDAEGILFDGFGDFDIAVEDGVSLSNFSSAEDGSADVGLGTALIFTLVEVDRLVGELRIFDSELSPGFERSVAVGRGGEDLLDLFGSEAEFEGGVIFVNEDGHGGGGHDDGHGVLAFAGLEEGLIFFVDRAADADDEGRVIGEGLEGFRRAFGDAFEFDFGVKLFEIGGPELAEFGEHGGAAEPDGAGEFFPFGVIGSHLIEEVEELKVFRAGGGSVGLFVGVVCRFVVAGRSGTCGGVIVLREQ